MTLSQNSDVIFAKSPEAINISSPWITFYVIIFSWILSSKFDSKSDFGGSNEDKSVLSWENSLLSINLSSFLIMAYKFWNWMIFFLISGFSIYWSSNEISSSRTDAILSIIIDTQKSSALTLSYLVLNPVL